MGQCEHGDNCDCQDNQEESFITLTLDDGTELECAIISIFPAGENEYIALLPVDETKDEESEVYLYRFIESDNGEIELLNIESDEEYELVADAFDEILDEEEFNEMGEEE